MTQRDFEQYPADSLSASRDMAGRVPTSRHSQTPRKRLAEHDQQAVTEETPRRADGWQGRGPLAHRDRRGLGGRLWVACATAAFAAAMSCGHGTATGPSSGLQITNATPSQPTPSATPQLVQFQGEGFTAGLVLQVADPTGAIANIPASQIQGVTSTSFQASLVLAMNGTYGIVVQEPNGTFSPSFSLSVGTGTTAAPVITSVSPSSTAPSTASQVVSITGTNFSASPTVVIVDPSGINTTASSLSQETNTSIQFSFVFNRTGSYMVTVTTVSGAVSNAVPISVQ